MNKLKIAVIGAGSTYTPELIEGLIKRRDSLPMRELHLMDIDAEKLSIVGGLAKRMLEREGMPCKTVLSGDLDAALADADFVMVQVRVGRLPARILDERIPLKYNLLGQETTGIGGFFKAMRTIPVLMNVAKKMEKLCPDAWMINFSNPSGIIAEALLSLTGVKMMGLCNVPINMYKNVRDSFPDKDLDITYLGLNHLSYITSVKDKETGEDLIKQALEQDVDGGVMANIPKGGVDSECFKAIGAIPSSYLHYFYFKNSKLEHVKKEEKVRGEVCEDLENELLDMYRDENLTEKPKLLEKRGGALYSEAAVSLIDAIYNDKKEVHVVNVKNNGTLPFLRDTDVVEVPAVIGKNGAETIKIKDFDNEHIISLISSVKSYERLTVKAALTGDDRTALQALMTNPLILDYNDASACYKEMKEAHKNYLPMLGDSI